MESRMKLCQKEIKKVLTKSVVSVAPGVITAPDSSKATSSGSAGGVSGSDPVARAHPEAHTGSEAPEETKGTRFHEADTLSSHAASMACETHWR